MNDIGHDMGRTALDPAVRQKLVSQRAAGASWFLWIALVSLGNSIVVLSGGQLNFVLGLGVNQFLDAIAAQPGNDAGLQLFVTGFALSVNLAIVIALVLLARGAKLGKQWCFVAGAGFYALDTLLFIVTMDVVGVAFHLFALVLIWVGYRANSKLQAAGEGS